MLARSYLNSQQQQQHHNIVLSQVKDLKLRLGHLRHVVPA